MDNKNQSLFVIEIHTDKYDAAAHFFRYASRNGYKAKILEFPEDGDPKEVARYDGIKR